MSDTWADLKPKRFFKQEDVESAPLAYTIKSLVSETVDFGDKQDKGTVVAFEETERQVFCKTVLVNQLQEMFPAGPSAAVGQRVELYRDPSVMMGSKRVGGLRFRKPTSAASTPF